MTEGIAKFGKHTANGKLLQQKGFRYSTFEKLRSKMNCDPNLSKVNSDIWHCAKFHENWTYSFLRNHIECNLRSSQPTNLRDHNIT